MADARSIINVVNDDDGDEMKRRIDANKVSKLAQQTLLFEAVRKNKPSIVSALLEKGVDPNKEDSNSDTPLMVAAYLGYVDIVRSLISKGADVNTENTINQNTPLIVATSRSNLEMVRVLLENGADPNQYLSEFGRTAIFMAVLRKNKDIISLLVEKGADINADDRVTGETPLMMPVRKNNLDLVQFMLEKGADKNARTPDGRSVIDFAITDEMRSLIRGIAPAPSAPYSGKSKSDIEFFNLFLGKVDETTTEGEVKNMIRNTTFCPVCLTHTIRVDGCLYMHHICSEGARHGDLYAKYKNDRGEIWWCVDCCRICAGHRHYKIGLAADAKPTLLPDGDPFARACDGSDGSRTNGGGSTTEKLKRIARMIDYAFELQHFVGELSEKEAKNELVEEVWNAATMRMRYDPLKFKKWKTDLSVFTDEKPTVETVPEAVPAEGDVQDPVIEIGSDPVSLDDDIPVIQFRHKNKDGVMFDHIHPDGTKYFLGKASLIEFMSTMGEKLGKCFDDECGGWLWPQEIEKAFADPRLGVTDEDRALLAKYKERFNSAKAPKTGGARWKFNFVSEMENGECYLPPKKKAGNRTRKSKPKRKTNKQNIK